MGQRQDRRLPWNNLISLCGPTYPGPTIESSLSPSAPYLSSHHNQNHLSILTPDESLSWQSLVERSLLP